MSEELPEHVRRNRAQWDDWAAEYAEPGQRNWAQEPSWGLFGVPESELHVLPDDLEDRDTIELGQTTIRSSSTCPTGR